MNAGYLGEDIKKLGFGLMRLPQKDGEVDLELVNAMVDEFMAQGYTYFDTAYNYGGGSSEIAARKCIVERYPRESFTIATKLPIWEAKDEASMKQIFETSMERTQAGYIDFYLLHSLNRGRLPLLDKFHAWDFIKQLKAEGRVKHIGISYHDTADALDELLTKHPEVEFVQLQINYADWEDLHIQSKKCYEVCMKHEKPVIIMEPVKGGLLASMAPEVEAILKAAAPDKSIASWALRFVWGLPGLVTVLSGMNTMEQMKDNLDTCNNFTALNDAEQAAVKEAVAKLNAIETVPCTNCKYCMAGCPQSIQIPGIFKALNMYRTYGNLMTAKIQYMIETSGDVGSKCVECGQCEDVCPQHISIIDTLKEAVKLFE